MHASSSATFSAGPALPTQGHGTMAESAVGDPETAVTMAESSVGDPETAVTMVESAVGDPETVVTTLESAVEHPRSAVGEDIVVDDVPRGIQVPCSRDPCADEQILAQVASAVRAIDHEMRNFCDWRTIAVVRPCLSWASDALVAFKPVSVSLFGSAAASLDILSSDFDVAAVLPAGCKRGGQGTRGDTKRRKL